MTDRRLGRCAAAGSASAAGMISRTRPCARRCRGARFGTASAAPRCWQALTCSAEPCAGGQAAAAGAPDPLIPGPKSLNPRTWYARTSSSRRMDSWMVWLEMAAAVRGATPLPCSKAWYASATASGFTPRSAIEIAIEHSIDQGSAEVNCLRWYTSATAAGVMPRSEDGHIDDLRAPRGSGGIEPSTAHQLMTIMGLASTLSVAWSAHFCSSAGWQENAKSAGAVHRGC
jgi:hypothetical protein